MYTTGEIIGQLFEGFGVTLQIFALTLVFAIPLGLGIAFCSMSKFKPLSIFSKSVVWIIRGSPLMLQIFIVFYIILAPFQNMSRIWATVITFSINYAAYFSEIFRGGIESIPRGQYEASKVLGISKPKTFVHVIFPQLIKNIIPPIGNEFITLVKDTALARVIGVMEIIFIAESIKTSEVILWPFLATGIFYLVFNGFLTLLFQFVEKKLNYYHR